MKRIVKKYYLVFIIDFFILVSFFLIPTISHASPTIRPIYEVLGSSDKTGQQIRNIWQNILNAINLFVILVLIIVAFSQILRINVNTYGVKKVLPAILLAAIAANFSFLICRLMIDISNVFVDFFILGAGMTADEKAKADPNQIVGAFNVFSSQFDFEKAKAGGGGMLMWYIIGRGLVIAGAILILILAFLFFIRNWVIYFLIPLAPLAFMATILPQSKSLFNQWWSNFAKWVFMPVVSCFWLWVGGQWYANVGKEGGGSALLNFAFAVLCYYLALTTPFKLGGGIMSAWSNVGKRAIKNRATAWAGREAMERGRDIGIRTRDRFNQTKFGKAVVAPASKKIDELRQKNISARQERLLRAEGPSLLRKKREEDARLDAAYRLAENPNTDSNIRKRYISMLRAANLEERKTFENLPLPDLLKMAKFNNDDGSLATPENNHIDPATGKRTLDPNARFTSDDGARKQMAIIEQIKTLLRRPNSLSAPEHVIYEDIINNRSVTVDGRPRKIGITRTGPGGTPDTISVSRLDPSGFGVSAVGPSLATQSAQAIIASSGNDPKVREAFGVAQFGAIPVTLVGLGAGGAEAIRAIRADRDRRVNDEFRDRSRGVEDTLSGVRMVMDSQAKGIRLGRTKSELSKAEEFMRSGDTQGARSIIEGISGKVVAPEGEIEQALETRIGSIRRGTDYFDQLGGRISGISDATARQEEFTRLSERMKSDSSGFLAEARREMLDQARIDSHATVAAQNVIGNVQTTNQGATPEHLSTSDEAIEHLTHAVEGLHQTFSTPPAGGTGTQTPVKIEPSGLKSIVGEAIRETGAASTTFKSSTPFSEMSESDRRRFEESLARGITKAGGIKPSGPPSSASTAKPAQSPPPATPPPTTPPPSTTPPR